ncbi:hypothetical protein SAMN02745163_00484 [Clostridium cavendishii DSM 21758]|uniref:Uncharacterized protein n=1 Tax=Clostridium cavendishii DSM 21758 TaxID=1121302 RepID=A0A1M6CK80_9CLOT|nr:hypothetical protein [Clostridium cavendishii]SHI61271.1 hypothetical protein SAMN02745163_00484 [Clostridium cavendishii DSM 21758]
MVEIIKKMMSIMNDIHDKIMDKFGAGTYNFSDKQLHFIIIGIIGILIFAVTQIVFKKLAKHSITAISFIYTFTVLLVIVFGIELEQKITKRGNMEFGDIAAGVNGFLYLFGIYLVIKLIVYAIRNFKKEKRKK